MNKQHIYFWKPTQPNGFLGNWYDSPFDKDGVHFINNEQYFMWAKQQLFDPSNKSLEKKILETNNPKDMKDFGRLVKNFNQTVWDEKKYDIMKTGLIEKFSQNPDLKIKLKNRENMIKKKTSFKDFIPPILLHSIDLIVPLAIKKLIFIKLNFKKKIGL